MELRGVSWCVCVLSAFVMATATPADIVDPAWQVAVQSDAGFGVFEVGLADGVIDPVTGAWSWEATAPVVIQATVGGATLAVLNDAAVTLDPDPQIAWNFAVQAGELDAQFEIRSSLVSFPTISASVAEGRASSGFTVTDLNGDGAVLQALGAPGAGAYTAAYNGWWGTSTEFVSMINMVAASPGGTGAMSQSYPSMAPWWVPMGDSVSDMSSRVWFSLTANDSATGSNNYEIVPEPSTVGLLVLGTMAVLRRRSRLTVQ